MRGPKAIIHLDRLKLNYDQVKSKVMDKPLMVVVKANGYGHGAVPCARALESHGCNFFAVFTIEEGLELRNAGIVSEILVFSKIDLDQLDISIQNNLTLNVAALSDLKNILNFQIAHGRSPKFHLKVETGMTRLGVDMNDIDQVIQLLSEHSELNCEGIYSHFATADEGDLSFALTQEAKFNTVLNLAKQRHIQFKYTHISNSGAVLNMDQSNYNVVRVGMLVYGAYPSEEVPRELDIKPVMTLIAPIVSIRRVPKGTPVSYGGVYRTNANTNIGVVQCGFADGYPRNWYKDGYVYYQRNKYLIAGRICMDQFMVDFGDTAPKLGDHILLIGENEHGIISMEKVAKLIKSTPYVLSTAIGGRTERIFQD